MIQRLEQIKISHPVAGREILHSVNVSDCIVTCQSRYPLCMAVSYWEVEKVCHLMAGGLEDPSTRYDVDNVWTSYIIYTKGMIIFRISLSEKRMQSHRMSRDCMLYSMIYLSNIFYHSLYLVYFRLNLFLSEANDFWIYTESMYTLPHSLCESVINTNVGKCQHLFQKARLVLLVGICGKTI